MGAARASAIAPTARDPLSDEDLRAYIHEALVIDPRLDSAEVQIQANDGCTTSANGS